MSSKYNRLNGFYHDDTTLTSLFWITALTTTTSVFVKGYGEASRLFFRWQTWVFSIWYLVSGSAYEFSRTLPGR